MESEIQSYYPLKYLLDRKQFVQISDTISVTNDHQGSICPLQVNTLLLLGMLTTYMYTIQEQSLLNCQQLANKMYTEIQLNWIIIKSKCMLFHTPCTTKK